MDTTPKYIKMCEMAEEIQVGWQYEDGDFYLHRFPDKEGKFVGKEVMMILCQSCNVKDSHGDTYVSEYSPKGENIWLPRQDQLLKMVEGAPWKLSSVKMDESDDYFFEFQFYTGFDYWIGLTPEQAIIQGVMHEKFNKAWDDSKEQWILGF